MAGREGTRCDHRAVKDDLIVNNCSCGVEYNSSPLVTLSSDTILQAKLLNT